jgi:CRISPR-associated endonuclease Csn1
MKVLGIDIGSSSMGWFIREFNSIVKYGVITFKSGMVKGKSGGYSSPAKDRREYRLSRNLKRARRYRKWALLDVLIEYEMVPLTIQELDRWRKYRKGKNMTFPENEKFKSWIASDFRYQNGINYKNPYEIRVKGLDEKLTPHEFGRTLYNLVQRRGYKDIGEKDKETKKQIERREQTGFGKVLSENRTIGESLLKEYLNKNKRARNEYPYRVEYLNELESICKKQGYEIQKKNNSYCDKFIEKLHKAIIWQRPLRSQKGNIGYCTLEKKRRRCAISHPLFEIFRALSFINTIRIIRNNEKIGLSESIRKELLNLFLKKNANFKFEDVRSKIDRITKKRNKYNYPINKEGKYNTTIAGMPFCKNLIDFFGNEIIEPLLELAKYDSNSSENYKLKHKYSLYDFWHFLFDFNIEFLRKFSTDKLDIYPRKKKNGEIYHPIDNLKKSLPDGYSNLSIKALRKIIPFLQEGFLYNDAVLLAKLPDYFGDKWEINKSIVYRCLGNAKENHSFKSLVIRIANKLIEEYKSLEHKDKFALKDTSYKLSNLDYKDVEKMCEKHFGKVSWMDFNKREKLLEGIKVEYQKFFENEKRNYKKVKKLSEVFKSELINCGFEIGELYHHSDLENIYGATINHENKETGKSFELLPPAIISSIKNPMFNKSMTILRKLINELILEGYIDEETKIIIEIPRGQIENNNERQAYIDYTEERETKRNKYKAFLEQYNKTKKLNLNIEEKIPLFELWNEQILKSEKSNLSPEKILKLKDDTLRYDLWMEQKAQCMYTGKMISISQLFSNEIQIEHTIPRSILPDNTMANKTVCFRKYNNDIKNEKIPFECPNYSKDFGKYSRIDRRLEKWKEKRDQYESLYESRKRAKGKEDEKIKSKRVKEKHFFKYKFNYWKDKIARFEAKEVKESWARRQLVDTQMASKYARELLKTKFNKVEVVNTSVNVAFRKMYGFQSGNNEKKRDKHTHHIIDAAVLSVLPINGSTRLKLVRKMYKMLEEGKGQLRLNPPNFENLNAQKIISKIENNTLVVNYSKDTIIHQTFKCARKRSKVQYLKQNGNYVLNSNGQKTPLISRGDTIRGSLFQETFIGKIRETKRDEYGNPLRDNDKKLIFHEGEKEFSWVERKKIEDILTKTNEIVDPKIRKIIEKEKLNAKDPQGNQIRRVRIKVKQGKIVKKRLNYKSKHEYKNHYYCASGSIPYALFLQNNVDGIESREWIPIHAYQIAQVYRMHKKFNPNLFLQMFDSKFKNNFDSKLLKIGQKVLVLNNDTDYDNRFNINFQNNRLFKIKQFHAGGLYLKHHLVALDDSKIDDYIKQKKDLLLRDFEKQYDIPEIKEDTLIDNNSDRIKDYKSRKFSFDNLSRYRFKRLLERTGLEKTKEIKTALDKYKTQSSLIEANGETPLLKMSANKINFLFEGYDFNISLLGDITFLDD